MHYKSKNVMNIEANVLQNVSSVFFTFVRNVTVSANCTQAETTLNVIADIKLNCNLTDFSITQEPDFTSNLSLIGTSGKRTPGKKSFWEHHPENLFTLKTGK